MDGTTITVDLYCDIFSGESMCCNQDLSLNSQKIYIHSQFVCLRRLKKFHCVTLADRFVPVRIALEIQIRLGIGIEMHKVFNSQAFKVMDSRLFKLYLSTYGKCLTFNTI